MAGLRTALLVSRRELRQGKRTFLLAVLTTILASSMLAAVLGLGDAIRSTLLRDARTLLGGDFEIRHALRDFTPEERDYLRSNSRRASELTQIRSAAYTDELSALVSLRAIDAGYPLFGKLELADGSAYAHTMLAYAGSGPVPALISTDLAGALSIGVGDVFSLGAAELAVIALVSNVPDPSQTMLLNAPLIYIAKASLPATGLDQLGTIKSERIRLDVDPQAKATWRAELEAAFPDNEWRIRGTDRVVPNVQEVTNRMETLMLLVSLSTLLIAGICIGNTVSTYMRSRARSIAVLKSLGMPTVQIQASYMIVTLVFVLAGCLVGVVIGFYCQNAVIELLSARLPFEIDRSFTTRSLLVVPVISLLTAWIFAIRPLHKFCSISPVSLFSLSSGIDDATIRAPANSWRALAAPVIMLAATLLLVAGDQLFLLYFTAVGVAVALLFRSMALGLIWLAKRANPSSVPLRISLRSISRSRDQIIAAATSLGIGLTALLTFSLTEANFNNLLDRNLANKAPAYYLVGLQPGDEAKIRAATASWLPSPEAFVTLPTTRGKVTHFNDVDVETLELPEDHDWIVHGNRYLTWAADQTTTWTGASRVAEGPLWQQDNDRLLMSFDAEAAEAFGLGIGDSMRLLIGGERYDVTIANLRKIDWSTLDVNFAIVLSGGPWERAPHTYLGSVREIVGDHHKFQRALIAAAPSVTPIRTETIISSVNALLEKIGILLAAITLTATVSGVLVLAAAIAEGQQRREHESIVLRILGTSHPMLAAIFRIEFIAIASLALVPAIVVSNLAGYAITRYLLNLEWNVDAPVAAMVIVGTFLTVMIIGALNTNRLVRTPALELLRNE